jgi:hypothetical protein
VYGKNCIFSQYNKAILYFFWKITAMFEDWSNVGWANCEVTLQVPPYPDFTNQPDDEGNNLTSVGRKAVK